MVIDTKKKILYCLAFTLADDTFAIDVTQVQGVTNFRRPSKVPFAPSYMLGIIDLQGRIFPVIDLKYKLGLPVSELTGDEFVVILELAADNNTYSICILADSLLDVFDLDPEKLSPSESRTMNLNPGIIHGIGNKDEKTFNILEIDKIFSYEEIHNIKIAIPGDISE
jgi:purine-binding chemotaxis protein CheW